MRPTLLALFLLGAPLAAQENLTSRQTATAPDAVTATRICLERAATRTIDELLGDDAVSRSAEIQCARRIVIGGSESLFPPSRRRVVREVDSADNLGLGHELTLEVSIPSAELQARWDEARELAAWMGIRRVAVLMLDRVQAPEHPERQREDADGEATRALTAALEAAGFRTVVPELDQHNREATLEMLRTGEPRAETLVQLKHAHDAELYLLGSATAFGPGMRRDTHTWNSNAACRLVWTDSADVIHSARCENSGGADRDIERAAVEALQHASELLAKDLVDGVFREWSRWAFEGREVEVTIQGLTEDQEEAFEDGLREAAGLRPGPLRFGGDLLSFRISTKLSTRDLYRALRDVAKARSIDMERQLIAPTTLRIRIEH